MEAAEPLKSSKFFEVIETPPWVDRVSARVNNLQDPSTQAGVRFAERYLEGGPALLKNEELFEEVFGGEIPATLAYIQKRTKNLLPMLESMHRLMGAAKEGIKSGEPNGVAESSFVALRSALLKLSLEKFTQESSSPQDIIDAGSCLARSQLVPTALPDWYVSQLEEKIASLSEEKGQLAEMTKWTLYFNLGLALPLSIKDQAMQAEDLSQLDGSALLYAMAKKVFDNSEGKQGY
jgi:hypothetical protein